MRHPRGGETSRPPIPLGDPDALAAATRLTERAPYSGMEYGYYHGVVDPAVMKSVSVDVLYPGCLAAETEEARAKLLNKHVSRNTAQAPKVVRETPASYAEKHLPYARSSPEGALGWVHKILRKEKEVERLLHDNPDPEHGFLINVDPKWSTHPDTTRAGWRDAVAAANASESQNQSPEAPRANAAYANELYCLGLCHRRDVRSLRDLRGEHLPMLRAMLRKGREIAAETYGVPTESLRCRALPAAVLPLPRALHARRRGLRREHGASAPAGRHHREPRARRRALREVRADHARGREGRALEAVLRRSELTRAGGTRARRDSF